MTLALGRRSSPSSARSSSTLGAARLRGCVRGVRVPRRVHRDRSLRDGDVIVYAALLAMRADGQDRVTATLEAIGERTGRGARTVGAALDRLLTAEYVDRRRSWPSHPYTYRLNVLPECGESFDVITLPLMGAIAAGTISDGAARTWLAIDQALGWHGRTADTACELARRRGIAISTLRAHVDELVDHDAVEVQLRASHKGWSLLDPAVDFTPAEEPENATVDGPGEEPVRSPETCGSPAQILDGPYMYLPPKSPTPVPSELCFDRPVGDKLALDDDGRERPKKRISPWPSGGVFARPGVVDVLEVLDDVAPQWTRAGARRWLGGIAAAIAAVVDPATGRRDRLSAAAAATAIVELGDGILEDLAGRHVPAVRSALAIRAREVRQGLACGSCGLPYGPDVHECPWCVSGALPGPLQAVLGRAGLIPPEHAPLVLDDGALPPLQERLAAYQHLSVPLEQIRATDPEAAAALDANHTHQVGPPPCRTSTRWPVDLGAGVLVDVTDRPGCIRVRQPGSVGVRRRHRALCAPPSRTGGASGGRGPGRACSIAPLELRARPPPTDVIRELPLAWAADTCSPHG